METIQPETISSRNSLVRLWPWLMVLIVLLFVGFIRLRLLDMPLERDEGEYAYAGQLILQGIPPYELAYNMKLPGTYFACAAGHGHFRTDHRGSPPDVAGRQCADNRFCLFTGAKTVWRRPAGLAACATYGILSASTAVLGMAAHANHFVILFAVPATLLLWQARNQAGGRRFFQRTALRPGVLMKQPGICFGIFGFLVLLVAREPRNRQPAGFR